MENYKDYKSIINDSNIDASKANPWGKISKFIFAIFVFLLPIWVLPWTIFPLEINKAYLTFVGTAIIAILWLISFIQLGEIKIPKSAILLCLIIISLVWFIASIFSGNRTLSLIGEGYNLDSFSSVAIFVFLAILSAILFQDKKDSLRVFYGFFVAAIVLFIFQLFRAVFDTVILPFNVFSSRTSNLFGSWNELGIFFGLTALESLIFLQFFPAPARGWGGSASRQGRGSPGAAGGKKIFFGIILVLSLLALAGINFTAAWITLASFAIVLLIYIFSVSKEKRLISGLPLIIFIVSVIFIFLRPLVGDFLASANLNFIEVRPSWSATFDIAKSVLKENPVLGTGPGTFVYNWLTFKSQSINLTPFWQARFNSGVGLLPSMIISAGVLGILAWFVFLVFLLLQIFKVISSDDAEEEDGNSQFLLIASFLGAIYLWIFNIIYVPSFAVFALAFIFTGLFIGQAAGAGKIKIWRLNFLGSPKIRFVASIAILAVIIAAAGVFYVFTKKYAASYYFAKGISVFNVEGNIDKAKAYFSKAANFDPQDRYYRGLTEIGFLELNRILNDTSLPADELRVNFQNILTSTIQTAQLSVKANSLDPLNWGILARVYGEVVPLKIEGAANLALSNYDEALKRDPLNPEYLVAKARVSIQSNDLGNARDFLQKAIILKPDYVVSNFLLAQMEAAAGNLDEAIKRNRDAQFLAPNDIGILFQLGLLYYQKKDYDSAKIVFERAVVLNENYSNARYFAGLIYDREGNKEKALEQFEKIKNLNPDNQEIKNILKNIRADRPALEGIAPPAPAPEKREKPPLESKTQKEGELKSKIEE